MSKFTPAMVIALRDAVVPMVNETVAVTPAAEATLLDNTMDVAESKAKTMAG